MYKHERNRFLRVESSHSKWRNRRLRTAVAGLYYDYSQVYGFNMNIKYARGLVRIGEKQGTNKKPSFKTMQWKQHANNLIHQPGFSN